MIRVTKMLGAIFTVVLLLVNGGQTKEQQSEDSVSLEQFNLLQKEVAALHTELDYWQNTTINILKKYFLEDEANGEQSHCTTTYDSYIKDKLEELDYKIEKIYNETQGNENIEEQISQLNHPSLGSFLNPAPSCKLLLQGSPSGHYWIQNAETGYASLEYCDMTRRCCNSSTGGWMRVANLNITDTNQQCPSVFRLITSPKRMCGTPGSRCVSTTFQLNGVKYSRVCGKIIGYQFYSPDAFVAYYRNRGTTVDGHYVDGVSLTHGQRPRKHIWTFAAALDETRSNHKTCPCTKTNTPYTGAVPPFIGQDYFCDSGSRYTFRSQWYSADPLWDGSGCGPTSSCCRFNNPPWFCKQLPQPTTDDIEMRVCVDQSTVDEDIGLESVTIYVQ